MNKFSLTRFLVVIVITFILTGISFSQDSNKLTLDEEKKISVFIADVYRQLRRTRDVSVFLNQSPASDLIDNNINGIFDKEDLVKKELLTKANAYDLREYWIQLNNLVYLGQIYSFSKFKDQDSEKLRFPENIMTFINKNSVIESCKLRDKTENDKEECVITNIAELKKEIAMYKKVSAMLRKYFISYPPEKSALYRKNVSPHETEIKYFSIDNCSASYAKDLCFGLTPDSRVITLLSNLPIGMILAETNGKYKVLMFGGVD